jgi:hypothetical protein
MTALSPSMAPITRREQFFIEQAAAYLENPSYLMKAADVLGKPAELLFKGLDAVSPVSVTELIDLLLKGVMKGASATVPKDVLDIDFWTAHDRSVRGGRWHAATTAVTGGVGGIVGLPALAVELPITTGVMFRSIANTARNFGRDLSDPEAFLDCIAVFSYGGGGSADDAMDSAYLSIRAAMATEMRLASQFLAKHTGESFAQQVAKGNCPAMLAFMSRVAAQFNIALTPKLAAFLVPGISIASGALVNTAFTQHFNRVATYHFGLQRLAGMHGADEVYGAYRLAATQLHHTHSRDRCSPPWTAVPAG